MFESEDRRYELINLARSLAMLRTGANALDREAALELVEELSGLRDGFDALHRRLRQLLEDGHQLLTQQEVKIERDQIQH
jgi:hypothetical protein